jgi:putative addiction module killer protein
MAIRSTPAFEKWLRGLKDQRGRAKVLSRIDRLRLGNPGDVKSVGGGVSEMRIDFGPGYRVYVLQRGDDALLLLGGDKGSQERNIKRAKEMAGEARDENETLRRSRSPR